MGTAASILHRFARQHVANLAPEGTVARCDVSSGHSWSVSTSARGWHSSRRRSCWCASPFPLGRYSEHAPRGKRRRNFLSGFCHRKVAKPHGQHAFGWAGAANNICGVTLPAGRRCYPRGIRAGRNSYCILWCSMWSYLSSVAVRKERPIYATFRGKG